MPTDNKLNNEEIAKIFGTHLNKDCQTGDDNVIKKLTGISYDDTIRQWWCYFENEEIGYTEIENCKLLLTPLDKISDEDAIEVAKIADILPSNWFEYKKYSIDKIDHPNAGTELRVLDYSVRITNVGGIYFYDYSRPNTGIAIPGIIDVLDFLRSKGYALPYKGKSLFELGIAIDKTTLNKQP